MIVRPVSHPNVVLHIDLSSWHVQRAAKAGIDYMKDQHLPLLVRAVYGNRIPKMVLLARDPVQRLYSAYFGYPHYHNKYGLSSEVGGLFTCPVPALASDAALRAMALPDVCTVYMAGLA